MCIDLVVWWHSFRSNQFDRGLTMPMIMIPDEDKDYLAQLFSLKPGSRDAFLKSIEDPVNISKLDDFTRYLEETTGIGKDTADKLMRILFTIYNAYDTSGESSESFVINLIDSFKETIGDKIKGATDKDYEFFQDFFLKIFALHNTFGVRAKAFRLMPEHQYLFYRSEIYSDIRPIFRPDDPTIKPSAAVIIHSLKIVYRECSETREIYIGLDDDDLLQLKATIDRAISKHECLKSMISDIGIQCLGLEREE